MQVRAFERYIPLSILFPGYKLDLVMKDQMDKVIWPRSGITFNSTLFWNQMTLCSFQAS